MTDDKCEAKYRKFIVEWRRVIGQFSFNMKGYEGCEGSVGIDNHILIKKMGMVPQLL